MAVDAFSLIWNNSYFSVPPFSIVNETLAKMAWYRYSAVVPGLPTQYMHVLIAVSYGHGQTLVFLSFKKQYQVDTHIIYQTDGIKGIFKANMDLKASLQESTQNRYIGSIKLWMV